MWNYIHRDQIRVNNLYYVSQPLHPPLSLSIASISFGTQYLSTLRFIQQLQYSPFSSWNTFFWCNSSLKGRSSGHGMPTKQGFGEFNAHNSSRENVSAGTVVFAWISMPSFDSSTNRSILLLAVICWWNLPFVCCFSVARSVCVQINKSRLGNRDHAMWSDVIQRGTHERNHSQ